MIRIAPSILSADFSCLGTQIKEAEDGGADWIHLDVMDGHFVPNITFGPPLVQTVRKCTRLPLDVHLMIMDADKYIYPFREAGADIISVHQESCRHLQQTIEQIQRLGAKAGVVLNPSTPVQVLKNVLEIVDLVLIMTVEPGFGGQQFIPDTLQKIQDVKKMLQTMRREIFIEVDGGIDPSTAKEVIAAGADVLVSGKYIFESGSIHTAMAALRASAQNTEKVNSL